MDFCKCFNALNQALHTLFHTHLPALAVIRQFLLKHFYLTVSLHTVIRRDDRIVIRCRTHVSVRISDNGTFCI